MNGNLDSLFDAGIAGGDGGGDSFVFCLLAIPTPFRRIDQTFIPKKTLLAD
ncbi:hypothetical protein BH10ACI1_BH10ACI1_22870 [soil metagenome]